MTARRSRFSGNAAFGLAGVALFVTSLIAGHFRTRNLATGLVGFGLACLSITIGQLVTGYAWKNLADRNEGDHRDQNPRQFSRSVASSMVGAIVAFGLALWKGHTAAPPERIPSPRATQSTPARPTPPEQPVPVVTLAANENGKPQVDYRGPGALSYRSSLESFTFRIGPVTGSPWLSANGGMKFSDTNHVIISIQSSSDRPYEIELLGVWTNRTLDIPESMAKEHLRVEAG